MKSRQLLSVVFSLIMFTGVTAGSTAFADSENDLDDILEGFCEIDAAEHDMFFDENPDLADFREEITDFCTIEDLDEREDAIDAFVDANFPEARDDTDDDMDDVIDDFEDCVEAGYPVMESYPEKCMIDDGTVFVNEKDDDHDDDDDYGDFDKYGKAYICHNNKNTISVSQNAVVAHLGHGDSMGRCGNDKHYDEDDDDDKMHDKYSNKGHGNLRDHFAMYCDMTVEERAEKMQMHDDLPEDLRADMMRYCEMTEDEQDSFRDSMMDRMDNLHDYMKDKMHTDEEFRDKLEDYCGMSDSDKAAYIAEHDKTEDKAAKMDRYCTLDENGKTDFVVEHLDEYRAHMMAKYSDKKHMDYDALCEMVDVDLAAKITDAAKLEKINEWCAMTPEEREEYKKKHHDGPKDKKMDKRMNYPCTSAADCPTGGPPHDFDRMSDVAKDRMSGVAKDKLHDKKIKFSDKSDRLKAMIMTKYDISDERLDELKIKYREKHGDVTDEQKSELKIKYKKHMSSVRANMSLEHKTMIYDRIAEMKAFKADLRERSSDMTDEQKQELREEFIEKAQDMHLAWISPRTQMTAGLDPAEVECREGFSLVFKESNGVAMCLKADTALKMIERGVVVPSI